MKQEITKSIGEKKVLLKKVKKKVKESDLSYTSSPNKDMDKFS